MAKTIFITGASRGFGRIWAEAFLKRGDNVVATVRNLDTLTDLTKAFPSNLLVLKLDVTDRIGSFEAIETAKSHFGGIDVLINNAGFGHVGAVEEVDEKEVRAQFETNVLGSLWTIQAVLPIMREQNSGQIIQLSSALGINTVPLMGIYSAAKFAVEGLTETLASEVSGFGIKVTIVEPGGYSTDFFGNNSLALSPSISAYETIRKDFFAHAEDQDSGNPAATATAILKLVDSETPPLRLLLGKTTYPWVKHTYEERLKTWESWQEISIAAHGS
ncbi:NAD(P)-dependent dehydrogenase (short-subunit alcohol dehydrogenase family) [Chryseobacterium ginsenosidimutans]|uniref:SDR family NAD(P)-dependent oxidoreductase n=1 Tax=Chryseobacterium ginsenosidimutans TaxID=687846 RepID=UPI002786E8F6|nr:SDR family NAD(P)-dependent oxidoreductase [Chryseobacterium ginsenosidimutans]MDQ0595261.1 NAD(P)-dependent dehydrogenase (short-subunit alcohol dehydrogenase family) [Chryseobacterium ginsenosidimutans]